MHPCSAFCARFHLEMRAGPGARDRSQRRHRSRSPAPIGRGVREESTAGEGAEYFPGEAEFAGGDAVGAEHAGDAAASAEEFDAEEFDAGGAEEFDAEFVPGEEEFAGWDADYLPPPRSSPEQTPLREGQAVLIEGLKSRRLRFGFAHVHAY